MIQTLQDARQHELVILRRLVPYHLPNSLRMTVGSEEANRLVVAALAEFLGKRRND